MCGGVGRAGKGMGQVEGSLWFGLCCQELTDNDSISSSDSSLAMGASVRDRKSPQESGSDPLESSRRGAQGSRAEPCRGERHLRRHRACGSTTAAMTHVSHRDKSESHTVITS